MKALRRFSKVLILCALTFAALASEAMELVAWEAVRGLPPLVLPVRDGETPEQAAIRYRSSVERDPELSKLFPEGTSNLKGTRFNALSNGDCSRRFLLIANSAGDMQEAGGQVSRFQRIFATAGESVLVLPIAADAGLTEAERRQINRKIIENFPALVAMGGEDIDPAIYGDTIRFSVHVNPRRDRFESELIKDYVREEKGFFLGICRGHQITSATLGYKLVQDIPKEVGATVGHGNDWHPVELAATTHGLLRSVQPDKAEWNVRSFHHQAVIYRPGGPLEIAARTRDGVTEALEFKNGRGLLMQFHPEYMDNELGARILHRVVALKNEKSVRFCPAPSR